MAEPDDVGSPMNDDLDAYLWAVIINGPPATRGGIRQIQLPSDPSPSGPEGDGS